MPEAEVQEGVTQETTEASPAENQTNESQESQTDQSGSSEDKKVSESVPYDRFAEVNSKNKRYEEERETLRKEIQSLRDEMVSSKQTQTPQDPAQEQQRELVKKQLKELGFVDQSEVEQKLNQIEEDQRLESTMKQLEVKYNGSDGRPKFNRREVLEYARDLGIKPSKLESAYRLKYQSELMDYAIKQASGKTKPVKSETSDGSGSSQAGTSNGDLVGAVRKGDKSALNSLIKRFM